MLEGQDGGRVYWLIATTTRVDVFYADRKTIVGSVKSCVNSVALFLDISKH